MLPPDRRGRRHHQARQQLPAQDAGPGARAALPSLRQSDTYLGQSLRGMLARVARQHGGGRPGGQDGAHRLGAAAPRAVLRAGGRNHLTRVSADADSPAFRCLRAMRGRWPESRPVFWKPLRKNGARRRPLYEAQDARIYILAKGSPEGRIRFCRLHRPVDLSHLWMGRAHAFGGNRGAVEEGSSEVNPILAAEPVEQCALQAGHTLRFLCQSRKRRHQVIPKPQPISRGSNSHGVPSEAQQDPRQRRAVEDPRPTALWLGLFRQQQRCDLGQQAIGKECSRHLLSTRQTPNCQGL